MPASEARIAANQANSLKSTGPRTPEGKAASRANSLKHGLTGQGIVLAERDAAEVRRLQGAFEVDLKPTGELGRALVHKIALMAVRMDRCAEHEEAALAERVHLALTDFDEEWPEEEGPADPARAKMRAHVASLALFDPSKEAGLARKYEAAADRTFFRALKELRQVEAAAKAAAPAPSPVAPRPALGSSLPATAPAPRAAAPAPKPAPTPAPTPVPLPPIAPRIPTPGSFELPFSIGRAR